MGGAEKIVEETSTHEPSIFTPMV